MKLRDLQEVADAADAETLNTLLVQFAHRLDFGLISGALLMEKPSGRPSVSRCGYVPEAYRATYESFELGCRDPVLHRLARSSTPFFYDQSTYVQAQAADMWDFQAQFGFKTGIALSVHLPGRRRFILGFDRDQPLPTDEDALTRLMADLQLLAVHAMQASIRNLGFDRYQSAATSRLTRRELEVLGWTLSGKTAWEVGMLLNISERTAAIHANRATHKLECVSKHQAALKAMQLGLI